MGAVYKARDERLNNIVAVKEALVSDPALLVAFEKEAQRLARLRHAALPNVMDHFVENYQQYLVMEYIEGEDLAEKLAKRRAPFDVAEVLGWGSQLLAVLEYLHGQHPAIIHRDIKPQNVKVMPDNTLILLDFGLAKGGLTQHSRSGSSVYGYTLGYAPLEQMKGHGTDARSDLYSVSATLWNLLTAQPPVDARLREQAATHRLPDPLRPASELNRNVPAPLAQLLSQALALHPNQRPPNATTMRAMLRHERKRPQREQEAARRQAEEARRQAEVDKLQRELEAARRQAEYQRQQAEYDRKQREQAEVARRQAEYKRKQREQAEAARRQAEYERKQREQAEAARRQAEYERKQREQAETARRQAE
jgi:serine/threonine protein kinase